MQVRSRVKLCTTWSVFLRLLWYQILMMQPWVFCWNTGVVSYSRGPDHPEPTHWPWVHHPLLGGPVCGSWKSRLLGDTTSHSHAAPVLRGLVQLYNKEEGVSCKHALSLLGSVSNADWHTHTQTRPCGSWRRGAVKAGYLWYDIIRPGDGVLCHALFGFPPLTVAAWTPGLGKHVRKGSDWCAGLHTSCQSHFQQGNANVVTDKVLCWLASNVMRSVSEKWKGRWSQSQMKARFDEKLGQE